MYLLLAVKRKCADSPFVLLLNFPSLSPTKEEKGRTVVSHVVMMMMMLIIMMMMTKTFMALMMLKRVVMVSANNLKANNAFCRRHCYGNDETVLRIMMSLMTVTMIC